MSGWLLGVARRPSPHCDARPAGSAVDLLVIHGISLPPAQFGGDWIDALFCGELAQRLAALTAQEQVAAPFLESIRTLRVSAHLLVRRDGQVVQYVPLQARAWHAGVSCWEGRERCNDFSIGIELEGTDDIPYEACQYHRLAALCRQVMDRYPAITPARIVGHSDIAPGRKTDPGPAFEWATLRRLLAMPA